MEKSYNFENINGNVTVTIIDGDGNQVRNSISEFQKNVQSECGLILLTREYFDIHSDTNSNFSEWLDKGRAFSLSSIFQEKEYRRKGLLTEIEEKLEKLHRLILLGESGTSKSTSIDGNNL